MTDPKTPREIAETVNHGNDVDDYERYIEYCELAANAAIEQERARCAEIADRFRSYGSASTISVDFARGQHSAAHNIALAIRIPDPADWASASHAMSRELDGGKTPESDKNGH